MTDTTDIDPTIGPSGPGCLECLDAGGWWFHLRRCARCGHIGCCDSSPQQHATRHFRESGHTVMTSFEPGEDWFWSFETEQSFAGPALAPPQEHPVDQPAPGPAGAVPRDWRIHLH
ncbi:MAG: UBP-type zinc finger domain-containing protein [Aeromicrobium sp.]